MNSSLEIENDVRKETEKNKTKQNKNRKQKLRVGTKITWLQMNKWAATRIKRIPKDKEKGISIELPRTPQLHPTIGMEATEQCWTQQCVLAGLAPIAGVSGHPTFALWHTFNEEAAYRAQTHVPIAEKNPKVRCQNLKKKITTCNDDNTEKTRDPLRNLIKVRNSIVTKLKCWGCQVHSTAVL